MHWTTTEFLRAYSGEANVFYMPHSHMYRNLISYERLYFFWHITSVLISGFFLLWQFVHFDIQIIVRVETEIYCCIYVRQHTSMCILLTIVYSLYGFLWFIGVFLKHYIHGRYIGKDKHSIRLTVQDLCSTWKYLCDHALLLMSCKKLLFFYLRP